jgi:hypothetical protein
MVAAAHWTGGALQDCQPALRRLRVGRRAGRLVVERAQDELRGLGLVHDRQIRLQYCQQFNHLQFGRCRHGRRLCGRRQDVLLLLQLSELSGSTRRATPALAYSFVCFFNVP